MRLLLAAGVAVLSALVPAGSASSGSDPGERRDLAPGQPAPGLHPGPGPGPLPFGPRPDEGCTVPAGTSLTACPPERRSTLPESCVLPVSVPDGTHLLPVCPRPERSPEGRVLPVPPPTP